MEDRIQVFLSYKYHGDNNQILDDYYMAKELYLKLKENNIYTFFSDDSLNQLGSADYKREIDKRLDEADLLVVVATCPEHCESNWVRYEWDSYYNDILSNKKKGQIISYLEAADVRDYPRTIRISQFFQRGEKGLENIIAFIKSYFNLKVNNQTNVNNPCDSQKGSSYNYEYSYEGLGNEKKRLIVQGKYESTMDRSIISELLPLSKRNYYILDVGCSDGSVTFDVFNDYLSTSTIVGVDKFSHCVEDFNSKIKHPNVLAYVLNLGTDDWENSLKSYMNELNIKEFDLVYCSLSLHHISNNERIVKKLYNFISNGGYIYIRTVDDSLKLAYPNADVVYDIIKLSAQIPNMSDRFHGRKIFSILYKAKFKDIDLRSFLIDTRNKDMEERYGLFYTAFAWRKNYFHYALKAAKTSQETEKAMADYNNVLSMLDKIEGLFEDPSFYFGYYTTIAIAKKINTFFYEK